MDATNKPPGETTGEAAAIPAPLPVPVAERRQQRRRASDWPIEWITVSLFARKYGIDRRTVYKWLDMELLETYRIGAVTRVRDLKPPHKKQQAADAKL